MIMFITSTVGILYNQHNIDANMILSSLLIFICIFVFTLLGSYLREIYYIIKKKYRKIRLDRILLTTFTFSILLSLCADRWPVDNLDFRGVLLLSFLLGTGGYSLLDRVYDGTLVKIFIKSLTKVKKDVKESINEVDNEEENSNEQANEYSIIDEKTNNEKDIHNKNYRL